MTRSRVARRSGSHSLMASSSSSSFELAVDRAGDGAGLPRVGDDLARRLGDDAAGVSVMIYSVDWAMTYSVDWAMRLGAVSEMRRATPALWSVRAPISPSVAASFF